MISDFSGWYYLHLGRGGIHRDGRETEGKDRYRGREGRHRERSDTEGEEVETDGKEVCRRVDEIGGGEI